MTGRLRPSKTTEWRIEALARELPVAAMSRFEAPGWAAELGLPAAVGSWVGKRYRK
jgi:hypothetical protein